MARRSWCTARPQCCRMIKASCELSRWTWILDVLIEFDWDDCADFLEFIYIIKVKCVVFPMANLGRTSDRGYGKMITYFFLEKYQLSNLETLLEHSLGWSSSGAKRVATRRWQEYIKFDKTNTSYVIRVRRNLAWSVPSMLPATGSRGKIIRANPFFSMWCCWIYNQQRFNLTALFSTSAPVAEGWASLNFKPRMDKIESTNQQKSTKPSMIHAWSMLGHFPFPFPAFFDTDMSCQRGHGIRFCVSVAANNTASALGAVQPQALATKVSRELRSLGEDRQWRHAWVKDSSGASPKKLSCTLGESRWRSPLPKGGFLRDLLINQYDNFTCRDLRSRW